MIKLAATSQLDKSSELAALAIVKQRIPLNRVTSLAVLPALKIAQVESAVVLPVILKN